MELANYGSLSATARALGVTHVTISRRIANLEMDLGQPLFTRESGRYVLTEAGKRTLELAGPMAQSADAIVRAASSLHAKLIGPVRITAAAAVGIHIVMPGLREVRARHPDIDVDLRITDQNVNLARGDADIAVRLARPAGSSGIVSTKVAELAYYLYGARSYVDGREPELFEYIGYAIEETDRPEAATLDNLARGRRTAMRINHLGNRIEATRLGLGLALLPSVMAEICPELIRVSSGGPLMQRDVYVLVHEDLKEVPRVKACLDVLVGAIQTRSDGPH